MKLVHLFSILFFVLIGCRKHPVKNPCEGKQQPKAEFVITEMLTDTAFAADTVFRDNYVGFNSLIGYDSVLWKLGNDPRDFKQQSFSLSFHNSLGTIPITFTGYKKADNTCFPNDNGIYRAIRNVTMVEQVEKPFVTLSPLRGNYQGSFTDNPNDTFTVRVEYFDSAKYDVMLTGNKNFYWFSNFPKGFVGTTTASVVYPELQNGREIEMGYKCFQFGHKGQIPMGWCRAWLNKDTLTILSSGNTIPLRKYIGIRR